ncbi:MAG TPA: CoA-binding protein [Candidatus Kapabacteria bacterium]|nr:CoA-binding protein [Candidatus Kapabacteria bacterium]
MTIPELFEASKTIAVVGLSSDPMRSSYSVAMRMLRNGYTIIPVNPLLSEWEGLKSYPLVSSIPQSIEVDIVDIFRREEFILEIVKDSLTRKPLPMCIWLQQDLRSAESERLCEEHGVFYVEDACLAVDYGIYTAQQRSQR